MTLKFPDIGVDWYEITGEYCKHTWAHDEKLSSLSDEWQRELAALHRLESNVFNGGILQFLSNCGREGYAYASQALKKIGALKTAAIIDLCLSLVDEHFDCDARSGDLNQLMPNPIIGRDGSVIKEAGSVLPETVLDRISESPTSSWISPTTGRVLALFTTAPTWKTNVLLVAADVAVDSSLLLERTDQMD